MMELSEANATQDGTLQNYKNDILPDLMVDRWKRELLEITERQMGLRNGIRTRSSGRQKGVPHLCFLIVR